MQMKVCTQRWYFKTPKTTRSKRIFFWKFPLVHWILHYLIRYQNVTRAQPLLFTCAHVGHTFLLPYILYPLFLVCCSTLASSYRLYSYRFLFVLLSKRDGKEKKTGKQFIFNVRCRAMRKHGHKTHREIKDGGEKQATIDYIIMMAREN